jgi:hypothetical protein
MPKANLKQGNSVTENYKPHPIDVLFSVMQEFAKVMNPIPRYPKGTNHVPGGVAIVGEHGPEIMIDKNGKKHISVNPSTIKGSMGFDVNYAVIDEIDNGKSVISHKEAINQLQNAQSIQVKMTSSDEWKVITNPKNWTFIK